MTTLRSATSGYAVLVADALPTGPKFQDQDILRLACGMESQEDEGEEPPPADPAQEPHPASQPEKWPDAPLQPDQADAALAAEVLPLVAELRRLSGSMSRAYQGMHDTYEGLTRSFPAALPPAQRSDGGGDADGERTEGQEAAAHPPADERDKDEGGSGRSHPSDEARPKSRSSGALASAEAKRRAREAWEALVPHLDAVRGAMEALSLAMEAGYRKAYDLQTNVAVPRGSVFPVLVRPPYLSIWDQYTATQAQRATASAVVPFTLTAVRAGTTALLKSSSGAATPSLVEDLSGRMFLIRMLAPSAEVFVRTVRRLLRAVQAPEITPPSAAPGFLASALAAIPELWWGGEEGMPAAVALDRGSFASLEDVVLRYVMPHVWLQLDQAAPDGAGGWSGERLTELTRAFSADALGRTTLPTGKPLSPAHVDAIQRGVERALGVSQEVSQRRPPRRKRPQGDEHVELYDQLAKARNTTRHQTLPYLVVGPLCVASVLSVLLAPELDASGEPLPHTKPYLPTATALMDVDESMSVYSALSLWHLYGPLIGDAAVARLAQAQLWIDIVREAAVAPA